MTNYLILEELITARLKALQMTDEKLRILTASDAANVKLSNAPDKALIVMLTDDNPKNTTPDSQRIEQEWTIFCDVREARSQSASRAKAGELMATTLRALMSFQPVSDDVNFNKFERVKSPYRPDFGHGTASYPLTFRSAFYFNI